MLISEDGRKVEVYDIDVAESQPAAGSRVMTRAQFELTMPSHDQDRVGAAWCAVNTRPFSIARFIHQFGIIPKDFSYRKHRKNVPSPLGQSLTAIKCGGKLCLQQMNKIRNCIHILIVLADRTCRYGDGADRITAAGDQDRQGRQQLR